MADVAAIFGILLSLGIIFPGFLSAWWLLFPGVVERARARVAATPWQCFWLGGVTTALLVIPITLLLALPVGPAQLLGFTGLGLSLTVASLGAAGVAAHMARRLQGQSAMSPAAALVRSAIALELAAALPFIGWLVVVPLAIVVSLGAAVFALLHWQPAPRSVTPTSAALGLGTPEA